MKNFNGKNFTEQEEFFNEFSLSFLLEEIEKNKKIKIKFFIKRKYDKKYEV